MAERQPTRQPRSRKRNAPPSRPRASVAWFWILALCASGLAAALVFWPSRDEEASPRSAGGAAPSRTNSTAVTPPVTASQQASDAPSHGHSTTNTAGLPAMEVNTAVMVTVELDFGGRVPGIAEALRDIERRSQPDDGAGRTFAILDAYGGPTSDGRKLHLSMHVSAEKPGIGALVFRRTGEILWKNRIVATTNQPSFSGKNLTIYFDDGNNHLLTVDGSANPATLLGANIKEAGLPLRDLWNDGDSREVVFIYSACGCPVKVMCQRSGDRLVRTSQNPVIFPDDPAVVTVIDRLMQW